MLVDGCDASKFGGESLEKPPLGDATVADAAGGGAAAAAGWDDALSLMTFTAAIITLCDSGAETQRAVVNYSS